MWCHFDDFDDFDHFFEMIICDLQLTNICNLNVFFVFFDDFGWLVATKNGMMIQPGS